jgi:peroxiredoxin
MKRALLPILLLAAILLAIAGLQFAQHAPRTGYSAADFSLPALDGTTVQLAALRGRLVFLNFWATWCPPCREEMPGMEALYRRFAGRDFAMLAVSQDEQGAETVAPFVKEMGLTFPVLLDPEGTLPPRYGVTGYPETFLIDRNGEVVHHTIGPADWNSPEMVAYIEQLLSAPAGTAGQG